MGVPLHAESAPRGTVANARRSGVQVEPEPLLPVADLSGRHGSALLPFRVLQRAVAEVGPGHTWQQLAAVNFGPIART